MSRYVVHDLFFNTLYSRDNLNDNHRREILLNAPTMTATFRFSTMKIIIHERTSWHFFVMVRLFVIPQKCLWLLVSYWLATPDLELGFPPFPCGWEAVGSSPWPWLQRKYCFFKNIWMVPLVMMSVFSISSGFTRPHCIFKIKNKKSCGRSFQKRVCLWMKRQTT